MTKVITYNNIQLSFQADTSGIKASRSELAQLTREVNNQRTPLERFIRKIEVINQASSRLSPKDVEDRIRAVANSFLEAEKKAGRYRDALSALEAFTPQLAQEARNLRQSYDDLLKTEKELAEINARLAGEEALRVSQQESKRIQIEKQVLDFKKKQREEAAALAREEARMAMEIEKLKRAARKRERDDYVEEVSQNQKSLQLVERKIYNLESERKHYGTLLFLKKQIVMEEVKEDLVLKKLIQDEERQNALVARRMNLYRQMPSVMSRSQGVMAGARQFAQGASMGGMPGGMLVGMHPGAIAGMAVVGGIVASIKAYKDLRDNLVLLESQFGNTTDAQATFLQLRQLAAKSPLETRDLMAGAVTLKQYGLANAEVMPTMEKLAAVSGGSSERLAGLTRAFAQTSSAGKLMGQEVLQFVNSGFNPLNEMAKRTNVSMLELRKMMENGLLTSQDMKDSFTSATQEGGQFHGQMAKQAEELSAKYNAMIDSLRQVGEAIGGFLELPTKGVMRVFTDLFTHTANQLNILGKSSKMVFSAAFDQQNFVQNQESMWIDLENTMIGYYAYLTKQDFGPAIQKQDNLFASFEKRRLEAIEKEAKAREKARLLIEDEIFGLTAAKDAQEEFNAILMTKSQLEERDNAKKMEAFRLESERIANLKAQAEQISQPEGKRGSFQQILDKYMKESQSEQENFSKILEKTPLAKAAREILDRSQQDFLKNNPQVAIMEQAQRIADMINGGMLTMQHGSAELARVMQENTEATKQQSYDLPRTLQAGTVQAYQAMFGRDNTAKLQLAEQKRQVAEQQKANGLLNDLVNKNPIKAMN